MRKVISVLVVSLLVSANALSADEKPSDPLSEHTRTVYTVISRVVLKSAEKMPEENYSFKPAESVRSFSQILGHVADSQYFFCSAVLGEKNASLNNEKNKTSKADLIAALKDAFAYCDRAYSGMTDTAAVERVMLMGRNTPKLGHLQVNTVHTMEHYGNLVTYLRMKDVVPPTSEPDFMKNATQQ